MSKFTPGPWIWVSKRGREHIKINDNFHITTEKEAGGAQKLVGGISKEEDVALCSAAPDLYRACNEALKYFRMISTEEEKPASKVPIDCLVKALKKAEGRKN